MCCSERFVGLVGVSSREDVLNGRLIQPDWLFLPAPHRRAGPIGDIRKQETWREVRSDKGGGGGGVIHVYCRTKARCYVVAREVKLSAQTGPKTRAASKLHDME